MKNFLVVVAAIFVVSCADSGEFESRRDYVGHQMAALDTISSFENLIFFHDQILTYTATLDTAAQFSQSQIDELTNLYDSLSLKMQRRATELFPSDTLKFIEYDETV